VLTTRSTIVYDDLSYDAKVESVAADFGVRLKALRFKLGFSEPAAVAVNVYGPAKTAQKDRTKLVNYLLRIERENISVGFNYLPRLAKGLNFPTVSAFVQAIEQTPPVDPEKNALPTTPSEKHNPPLHFEKAAAHDRADAPSPVDFASLERVNYGLAEQMHVSTTQIIEAINGLGEKLADRLSPLAPARKKPASRRRAPGERTTKTA
jgi:transcriptional regulator with XRE-family HTH domain